MLALLGHLHKLPAHSEPLLWNGVLVSYWLLSQVSTNLMAQNNTSMLSCSSVGQKSHTGLSRLKQAVCRTRSSWRLGVG